MVDRIFEECLCCTTLGSMILNLGLQKVKMKNLEVPTENHSQYVYVKMVLDINPIYAGLGRSCARDSKNVSYFDVGLV